MNRDRVLSLVLPIALFLSSFLLFLVEPWQGKVLLPLLGGTPAVWNACMLFFQTAMLLGYGYAHFVATRLAWKKQLLIHGLVLLLPVLFLPPQLPAFMLRGTLLTEWPLPWLFISLALSSGPLFFVLATTSPLLQSWFARASDRNPYSLYAAGNVGSFLALVGYPLLIEPRLRLVQQAWLLAGCYVVLAGLIAWVAVLLVRTPERPRPETAAATAPVGARRRWEWIALALVPSSLMLGVTTFLTTDIAPIPMLWTLPLAIYILSFVIVFSRMGGSLDHVFARLLPYSVVPVLFLIFAGTHLPLWLSLTLHLSSFLVATLACHGRLARLRPELSHLTEFYFCLALGGVLGGVLNTLVAPTVFVDIAEYPLAIAAALVLCLPALDLPGRRHWQNTAIAALVAVSFAVLMLALLTAEREGRLNEAAALLTWIHDLDGARMALLFGTPLLLVFIFVRRPTRLAIATLGIVAIAVFREPNRPGVHRERSFFGVLTVLTLDARMHELIHGGIVHTQQWWGSEEERREPRTYFHRGGPLGRLMSELSQRVTRPRVGIIGLGGGTISAYCEASQAMTFYELDPNVERLARDPELFTYVSDAQKRGCQLSVVVGDGRLKINNAREKYDLIIVDAFSSDAIPIHLITAEALQVYRSRLNDGGVLAFHITNGYVNLEPVLHNLASELHWDSYAISAQEDPERGRSASQWVALAPTHGTLESLAHDAAWHVTTARPGIGVWRDDYANVVSVFRWQ